MFTNLRNKNILSIYYKSYTWSTRVDFIKDDASILGFVDAKSLLKTTLINIT